MKMQLLTVLLMAVLAVGCQTSSYETIEVEEIVLIEEASKAAPSLTLNKSNYAPGEEIVATFAGGPGNDADWVGIMPAGVKPGPVDDVGILCWVYVDGSQDGWSAKDSGTVTLDGDAENEGGEWPLAPGKYDVYFCCCDGYDPLVDPVTITVK